MTAHASRTIVLTGATRGLGRAMAAGFIERGHTVLGCGRTSGRIDELNARFGRSHRFETLDVSERDQVEKWAREILTDYGPPELLINNAAVINENAPLWDVLPDEFSRVVDVNIKGVYHVIRAFVPAMVERGRGVIVNFSSGWGRSTSPEVGPYCATKYAIEGLTKALAQELPRGMAAVPLNPGVIDTEMLRTCFGSSAGGYTKPDEWAKSAVPFILGLGPKNNGESATVPV